MTSSRTALLTLPTDEQILITREFNAPKHLVYEAWTTPELVKRWWSGKRGETPPGGAEDRRYTTVTLLVQATSKVSRDAIIDSGMEAGLQDALDLLEQVSISLR